MHTGSYVHELVLGTLSNQMARHAMRGVVVVGTQKVLRNREQIWTDATSFHH